MNHIFKEKHENMRVCIYKIRMGTMTYYIKENELVVGFMNFVETVAYLFF